MITAYLISFSKGLYSKFQYFSKKKWVRLIYWIGLLGICSLYLIRDYRGIANTVAELKINFLFIFLAWLITLGIVAFIGTTSWWFILRGLGQELSWFQSARIQLVSTLPKYIPGSAWQYVAKSYLLNQYKVPAPITGISFFFELGQTLWIGAGLSLLTFDHQLLPLTFFQGNYSWILILGLSIMLIGSILPWMVPRITQRFFLPKQRFHPISLFLSFVMITTGWLALGLVLWLIGHAMVSNPLFNYRLAVFTITTSLVVGVLILFAPNGFGVREGVMVLILGKLLSVPLSLLIALTSRLLITLSEVLCAVFVESIFRWKDIGVRKENTSKGV